MQHAQEMNTTTNHNIIVLAYCLLSTILAAFVPGLAPFNVITIAILILFAPLWIDK